MTPRNGERNRYQELQAEVEAIVRQLLRSKPAGTTMTDVWEEALSLVRRRYDRKAREKKLMGKK